MDKERQLKYNSTRSENNLECMKWFFLIINQNREIGGISDKIYKLFAPIEEEGITYEGTIKKTGLRWKLISFDSRKKVESSELRKVYDGRILSDRKLYDRNEIDGLEKYIINELDG